MDSVEKININELATNKWEFLQIFNPYKINLRLYGADIYNSSEKLYFIGGKIGKGNHETDYKKEIYCFDLSTNTFSASNVYYGGKLSFIENKFHLCNNENIGNFIELIEGCLATISMSSLVD